MLAPLQRDTHVAAAVRRNASVIFIEISSQKNIGDTLSIFLSKSIAGNTVDIRKVAAIIATSILTSLPQGANSDFYRPFCDRVEQ